MSDRRLHAHTLSIPVVMPSEPYCAGCVERLRGAVEALDGVEFAEVDKRTATLTVSHDLALLPEERIEGEVERLGFQVTFGIAHAGWRVTGLDCPDCARTVEKSVRRISGVVSADLNFATGTLLLEYDPSADPREAALAAVRAAGHGVAPLESLRGHESVRFRLVGLDCADCATKLGRQIAALPGVRTADVDFGTAVLRVGYDGAATDPARLAQAVRRAGYEVEQEKGGSAPDMAPPTWWQAHAHEAGLVASGTLIVVGYALELLKLGTSAYLPQAAFVLAAVAGGAVTARRALASLRARTLDMNVLMALAVIGAIVLGDFAEAAMVIFLFSIGQFLESRALARTRASIRGLVDLTPALARVRRGGREVEIPPQEAVVGDVLVVKPGERIALDGTVAAGVSPVDEAPITGESVPVAKAAGDTVYAGTLNGNGLLEVEVTRVAADSTLARVIFLVEEAQASRAPSQQLVDRFTRYYTPAVVIGAVAIAVLPPLLGAGTWGTWVYRALVMLVVSCPCALVISTPVAIVSAITRASRDGVLVKGGAFLETAARVSAVAFDKTGTLTEGRPEVTEVVPVREAGPARVLEIAAALEAGSTHPLAEAVLRAHGTRPSTGGVSELTDVAGRGLEAVVDGVRYGLGSPAFAMDKNALDLEAEARIEQLEAQGSTVLVLFSATGVAGLIAVADEPRPEARGVVHALRSVGIQHVVMLTGDNERTATAVAAHAGIAEHRARLLPEDKVAAVRDLQERHGVVAMVGDGVNDAPALATADIGIAMGAAGSDTALETADVALMSSDIEALPGLFDLGRRTVGVIRANVVFSIATKAVVLVLAVFGQAPLWLAVFADTGVSLLVTLNGLRLLRAHRVVRPHAAETLHS
jgi:Cd2+/Zn2+-exporting ATPase